MIDLRSDTVTQPTPGMLEAMRTARVGDDVFGEDPTVIELETKTAALFQMEAALFCPSGTMTNQIAIKVHTQPGDEVICHRLAHIYNYEGGGIMFNSGASVRLIEGDRGRFTAADVLENINPDDAHYPVTKLVCIENTCNKGGGSLWDRTVIQSIREAATANHLHLHLDGARLFNALTETGESPADYGTLFDTVSLCLSKGLGAPVGSVLLGTREQIKRAHRIRKVLGGGMRQAGFLAAAGIYALDHHITRLKQDHQRAKQLGATLATLPYVKDSLAVDTNIVVFSLEDSLKQSDYLKRLHSKGLRAVPFGPQTVRLVTHLDFDDDQLAQAERILKSI